jgi:hypothetical protein
MRMSTAAQLRRFESIMISRTSSGAPVQDAGEHRVQATDLPGASTRDEQVRIMPVGEERLAVDGLPTTASASRSAGELRSAPRADLLADLVRY